MVKRPQKTAQRTAIFNYLKNQNSHPSVKDIYQHVSEKLSCISLTTVYNTLEMLKHEGLVMELPRAFHKEGRRFSSNLTPHDHLICNYCGRVTDIDTGFDHSFIREKKFNDYDIKTVSLNVYGVCPECRTKKESELQGKIRNYQIESSVRDGILEIAVTGEITNYTFENMMNEILAIEESSNVRNELIDLRELKGRPGYAAVLNMIKKYPAFKSRMNTAVVDSPANAKIESFHAEMASNAGFNYQWFKNIRKAKEWLESQQER